MTKETSVESAIRDKIAWARRLFREEGPRLLRDPRTAEFLSDFRSAVSASHEAMREAGMVDLCRICEEEEGGSCCGAGLERHYDEILLLVNLLLGIELPEARRGKTDCLFLGGRGCLLEARQTLCVNYVCDKIVLRTPPGPMAVLREREGRELSTLFLLCARIREVLSGR